MKKWNFLWKLVQRNNFWDKFQNLYFKYIQYTQNIEFLYYFQLSILDFYFYGWWLKVFWYISIFEIVIFLADLSWNTIFFLIIFVSIDQYNFLFLILSKLSIAHLIPYTYGNDLMMILYVIRRDRYIFIDDVLITAHFFIMPVTVYNFTLSSPHCL